MIVFELLFLAFAGRVVIQADFSPRVAAIAYGVIFAAVDLATGIPAIAATIGRLASIALAEIHFRSLVRFSGISFLATLVFGAVIPAIVVYIQNWLSDL